MAIYDLNMVQYFRYNFNVAIDPKCNLIMGIYDFNVAIYTKYDLIMAIYDFNMVLNFKYDLNYYFIQFLPFNIRWLLNKLFFNHKMLFLIRKKIFCQFQG